MLANQEFITDVLIPNLASRMSNCSSYLNEGDFWQPNWEQVFHEDIHGKLLAVKEKYDPHYAF